MPEEVAVRGSDMNLFKKSHRPVVDKTTAAVKNGGYKRGEAVYAQLLEFLAFYRGDVFWFQQSEGNNKKRKIVL